MLFYLFYDLFFLNMFQSYIKEKKKEINMLDYAYFHQGELYDCYRKVYTRKELYFYLSYPQKDFLPNIYCNDSDYLQFVSLNSAKEIIGFFNGYINKDYQSLQNLEVINFTGQPNITFSKDVENYFDEVFLCKNLRKIEFTCIEENPALKLYRKLIKNLVVEKLEFN